MTTKFHLAFPVDDLETTRRFYVGLLGCQEGRSASTWADFDFFGHQLSAHLHEATTRQAGQYRTEIDGHSVPIPHFGVVLEWHAWHALAERLQRQGAAFLVKPYTRFQGLAGEQATLFILDPSGNALEFKAFQDATTLFAG